MGQLAGPTFDGGRVWWRSCPVSCPVWPADFACVESASRPVLPSGVLVNYSGSTAVPGLMAKAVIDIQITVAALTEVDAGALAHAGFERRAPVSNHCPPGLCLPDAELRKVLFGGTGPRRSHVHIRERGHFNQRYPLLCRDYLRSHPFAAAAYGTIKQRLAARFSMDAAGYYDLKDPLFYLIMAGAQDWAVVTGWSEPLGD
jgi:GrpB-like predicted nucleotidyltransferase (UPF0157 family)